MRLLAPPLPLRAQSQGNAQILLWAACTSALVYLLKGNKGYDFWDEGYFWYGVQRVLAGEVPIRDFMAYDPGRYYWSAGLLKIIGDDGLIALRASGALFQTIGIFIGLKAIDAEARARSNITLLIAAITLTAWMYPWFKVFDTVSSIAQIGALALVIRQPSPRRFLVLGTVVGLAAVFGRNHGVYGVIGSLGAIVFIAIDRDQEFDFLRSVANWALGIVLGFLPVILLAALIPGFAAAFWRSIIFLLFELKGTNLPLSVPWPWLLTTEKMPPLDAAAAIAQGCFFIAIIAFGILGLLWSFFRRLRGRPVSPTLVAASLLALPYAHYAFSRADIVHLAQGVFPTLIGCIAILASRPVWIQWIASGLLCGASILTVLPVDQGWQCHLSNDCAFSKVRDSTLLLSPHTIKDIALIDKLGEAAGPNGRIFVTPYWPGAYALLHQKSPVWEIYALFPRSQAFESAEIERLRAAAPRYVLLNNFPLDDREELRFQNTHPLIYQYVQLHYEPVNGFTDEPWNQVFKRKQVSP